MYLCLRKSRHRQSSTDLFKVFLVNLLIISNNNISHLLSPHRPLLIPYGLQPKDVLLADGVALGVRGDLAEEEGRTLAARVRREPLAVVLRGVTTAPRGRRRGRGGPEHRGGRGGGCVAGAVGGGK